MSNHQHLLVRDNNGNLPAFLAHLHKMQAKALNAKWGRWENLWATEQPNAVYLVEAADRLDKLVYLLVNPVAADLVEHVVDWPGACALGEILSGRERIVRRPRGYFREDGPMPDVVTLRAERPQGFEHLTDAEWADSVLAAVRAAESSARAARLAAKRGVLGRKRVLRGEHTEKPRSRARRRQLRPHLACKDPGRRAKELESLCAFRCAYAAALREWLDGELTTVFPPGTYRMVLLGAKGDALSAARIA